MAAAAEWRTYTEPHTRLSTQRASVQVKDIMYHLYMKAKEATERGAPAEVRILKYLVSIDDPQHRASELESAFKPVRPTPPRPHSPAALTTSHRVVN